MSRTRAVDAALVATVFIWAVNFSVVKLAIEHLDPFAFNTFRLVGATAILLLLTRFAPGGAGSTSPPGTPLERRDWPRFVGLGLLGHTGYQLFFIQSIDETSASNAAVLLGLTPVFVAALSAVMGVERPRPYAWLGIALSALGVQQVLAASGAVGGTTRGDLLALGAAVIWASYTVLGRDLATRYGAFKSNAYLMAIGTIFFLPFGAPALLASSLSEVPMEAWYQTAFSLTFALVFAYCAWYWAVTRIGPTGTAIYANLMPALALGIAHVWLGEPVSARQLLGVAAIVGGIYLVRSRPR